MPPPMKPWIARHTIISLIDVDSPHIRLAAVKPAADAANKSARAERPRQKARQRDHDHLGDQIGRSAPR